jgi:hypothetical protein
LVISIRELKAKELLSMAVILRTVRQNKKAARVSRAA